MVKKGWHSINYFWLCFPEIFGFMNLEAFIREKCMTFPWALQAECSGLYELGQCSWAQSFEMKHKCIKQIPNTPSPHHQTSVPNFGPSIVRALPWAAGINEGGHYFMYFSSSYLVILPSLFKTTEGVVVSFYVSMGAEIGSNPVSRSPISISGHFGLSGVHALPLAAGRNVGGHYKWHFFLSLSLLSSSLLILP
jgi:hypothetical protein